MSTNIKSVTQLMAESRELHEELSVDAVNKQKPRMKRISLPFADDVWSGWACSSLSAYAIGKTAEEAYRHWLERQLMIKAIRLMRAGQC